MSVSESTEEPDFASLAGAADAVRELIVRLRKTTAPKELLREVERDVNAVVEKLAPYDYPGPYSQGRLIMRDAMEIDFETDDPVEFFPYSPIIGPLNPVSPKVDFKLKGKEIHAVHSFGAPFTGPPASVHGGVIALVFDELLGSLGAVLRIGGFTGTLKIIYRSLTPIEKPIRMRSWVDREEGVKVFIKGQMYTDGPDGEVLCSEAEGIFIRPKVSILEDALKRSREG